MVEQSGGLTDHVEVGMTREIDEVKNGVVSGPVQQKTMAGDTDRQVEVAREADYRSVNGMERGPGDIGDVGDSVNGMDKGTDAIGDIDDTSDYSHTNISSEFESQSLSHLTCHSSDIDSDVTSVQELDHSDTVMRELQTEIQGYQDQMEHFRADSQQEHLAVINQLHAELSGKQHELELVKSQALEIGQELELVKSQAAEDETHLRRELRESFAAQLMEVKSELLMQHNEERKNWKNTAHSRDYDTWSGDQGQGSQTDTELIHTETRPKIVAVGENIESVLLRELRDGFEGQAKIMEERHLMKLAEKQMELDRLLTVLQETERSRGHSLEKMTAQGAEAGDSQLVTGDRLDTDQVTSLKDVCCKLKLKLMECSAQIKEYFHNVDTSGDKMTQETVFGDTVSGCVTESDERHVSCVTPAEEPPVGGDSESPGTTLIGDTSHLFDSGSGPDCDQTKLSRCHLHSVPDVTQVMLHCSREVDLLTQSLSQHQGWS